MKLEVCVDDFESAKVAIDCGVDRLEVCSALSVGGLTPTVGLVKLIDSYICNRGSSTVQRLMLRPRPGDFTYSNLEFATILEELKHFVELQLTSVGGYVIGVTVGEVALDYGRLELISNSLPPDTKLTIHRAVDVLPTFVGLNRLCEMRNIDTILTSGRAKTAVEGTSEIKLLQSELGGQQITVMPGSGVRITNVEELARAVKPSWVHCSVPKKECNAVPSTVEHLGFGPKYDYDIAALGLMTTLVHSL